MYVDMMYVDMMYAQDVVLETDDIPHNKHHVAIPFPCKVPYILHKLGHGNKTDNTNILTPFSYSRYFIKLYTL